MTLTNLPFFDPNTFPNFAKSTVGFDSIFKRLNELADGLPKIPTYPPYNIRKVEDNKYVIEMAVAGFGKQDLELELQEGVLTIKGSTSTDTDGEEFVFKGIADRAFTRKFTLADTVEVKNADLINGMLKIWLERFIPEEKKAKKININGEDTSKKQFLRD
jgi:molecular chaperone IbpA